MNQKLSEMNLDSLGWSELLLELTCELSLEKKNAFLKDYVLSGKIENLTLDEIKTIIQAS